MNTNASLLLVLVAAAAMLPAAALAEPQTVKPKPGANTAPAQLKPSTQQTPTPPAQKPPQSAAKPPQKPSAQETAAARIPASPHPTLLGQYDHWGAYWAAPNGRKVCFAAARPQSAQTNRGRNPSYLFITSRPQDKVKDEISAIVSFPLKSNSDATVVVGGKQFAMSTKVDGVWIKNQSDETKLIEAMRKGSDLVLKATTDRGLQSTDTFSMKGLSQALDRIARECK